MPTYSHSRLETYQNCPRMYKLQYIDKVEIEEVESIEAFLGSRVHETLEKLYKDVRMTKLPSLDEVILYFKKVWDENWNDSIKIVRTEYASENYEELGRKYVSEYYEQYYPFDESRTIALEHLVRFPLDDAEQYWIRGIIDRLSVSEEGTYEIHDYKTAGRLRTQEEVDKDRQLAMYHIGIQRMWQDVEDVDLVWHYLAFGKEMRSRRTPAELENLKGEIMDIIEVVESDTDFRPRESALCDWCAYPEYCPAKKHVIMTSKLPANQYLGERGVNLVNKFGDLHRRKSELEDEIGQIRDALIQYARDNDVQVIKGSGQKVLVRFYKGLAFPGRDDPARKELENIVKKSGLWEKVAVLSPVSLAKMVEKGAVEPELAGQIAALGWEEERPWVKLSKLRPYEERF